MLQKRYLTLHHIPFKFTPQNFFVSYHENSIEFWECPSHCNWSLHKVVDKETKSFNSFPHFSCKSLWDFGRKTKYDNMWKMIFQSSDLKGRQFFKLCNINNNPIKPSYTKDSTWLKHFGHSNSLCARVTRAIMNHALIG